MDVFILGFVILVVLTIFFTWFIITYNNFQEYIIRINEAEATIDAILRKRFDLLNKSIGVIKANVEVEEDILEEIVKLRSRKLSNFELDRKLYDGINEFNVLKEKHKELNKVENFTKIEEGLDNSEVEITASRNYYNETITKYNILVQTLPSNFIAKIYKYKHRNFFDNKDMTDEIINDFKL